MNRALASLFVFYLIVAGLIGLALSGFVGELNERLARALV